MATKLLNQALHLIVAASLLVPERSLPTGRRKKAAHRQFGVDGQVVRSLDTTEALKGAPESGPSEEGKIVGPTMTSVAQTTGVQTLKGKLSMLIRKQLAS